MEDTMCMIPDGMSKLKTHLPCPMRHTKKVDNGKKV